MEIQLRIVHSDARFREYRDQTRDSQHGHLWFLTQLWIARKNCVIRYIPACRDCASVLPEHERQSAVLANLRVMVHYDFKYNDRAGCVQIGNFSQCGEIEATPEERKPAIAVPLLERCRRDDFPFDELHEVRGETQILRGWGHQTCGDQNGCAPSLLQDCISSNRMI